MGAVTWGAFATVDDVGGTAFNSLADGSGAITSEVDNTTDRHKFMDIEVVQGGAVTSSGLDARIDVYKISTLFDGSTYPTPGGSGSTFTGTYYVGQISSVETVGTVAVTNFTNGILERVPITPTKFKVGLVNELGAAFNSSVTVKIRRYTPTVA